MLVTAICTQRSPSISATLWRVSASWLASLETLVGAHRCEAHATDLRKHAVDGLIPDAVVWPETAEQVAAVLHWAQREKLAVVPRGNGTKIGQGAPPSRLDLILSTRRLAQVSEYDVANF